MTPTDLLPRWQQRSEAQLAAALPDDGSRLTAAMRYALLDGGKRLRAALIHATAADFAVPPEAVDAAVCAVEAIHAYSLIHDDLPAMDDDDLRRGKPSCHKAFDEATAILAGDALNTLAFEWLAASALPADVRLAQIRVLAQAAGYQGMVAGQSLDMAHTGTAADLATLQTIHRGKTGALLAASLHLPALASADYAAHRATLDTLGEHLGLLYQISDDILDATADSQTLGKTAGKDAAQDKTTYISLLGLDASRAEAERHYRAALACCAQLPGQGQHLAALLARIYRRSH
ncbi:MAG: polyprenyl synthetase family protein [Cardiobacteriaceae bacterium]|nr:polyprenyl synthetase family protein [Cardiobacteriaceae bacterium]